MRASTLFVPSVVRSLVALALLGFAVATGACRPDKSPPAAEPGDGAEIVAADPPADSQGAIADVPPPPDLGGPPPTAERTASGLATVVLARGAGTVHPLAYDLVRFRYVGWTKDGKMFGASSPDPWASDPFEALVSEGGIPGLSEGLRLMVTGERRRFWIPASLASDAEPRPDLVMDVELVQILPTPRPPPPPDDVSGPPPNAKKTYSGLFWRLVSSSEKSGPRADVGNIAAYNFTTWTRAGEVVASSFPMGRPEAELVSQLSWPWNEALQLMRVGDTIRIWFAEDHGAPRGTLFTADVELLYLYSPGGRREVAAAAAIPSPPIAGGRGHRRL